MKFKSHAIALGVMIIGIVIFYVLKMSVGFNFGLRTYWPAFVCLYLVVWYYAEAGKREVTDPR